MKAIQDSLECELYNIVALIIMIHPSSILKFWWFIHLIAYSSNF